MIALALLPLPVVPFAARRVREPDRYRAAEAAEEKPVPVLGAWRPGSVAGLLVGRWAADTLRRRITGAAAPVGIAAAGWWRTAGREPPPSPGTSAELRRPGRPAWSSILRASSPSATGAT